jgi:UDP-N-acetylmuramoylalanine--D-glutamate ligase
MIPVRAYEGRRVAVFGLARTGIAAARALQAGGAVVSAWDDSEQTRAAAAAQGVPIDDLNRRDWGDLAALVLSPGVPLTHPEPHRVVKLAQAVGAPVIGDTELFAQALAEASGARVVGVTGTNGKSTTTALIGHVLRHAGLDVRVGGNIGEAVLNLDPPRPGAVYALELSSYQLDLTRTLRCDAAVWLNITPDHIDRHGDVAGYVKAKRRIFANQRPGDAAIIGADDRASAKVLTEIRGQAGRKVVPVSAAKAVPGGVYALGGVLHDTTDGQHREALTLADAPGLPGRHNAQNAAAAWAAARHLGVSPAVIAEAMRAFPGLAHRQERAGQWGKVAFVNDSKATNADAAAQALGCYDAIHWIVGGQMKSGGVTSLKAHFPRIRRAYLIGQDAAKIGRQLRGKVETVMAGTLEEATARAARDALDGDDAAPVVLLSPACASFDQFSSFEHRGDVFRKLVDDLIPASAKGDRP